MKNGIEFLETGTATLAEAVCRTAAKLYQQGKRVYVLAPTQAEAVRLNELMWTFDDQSFVPHDLWQGGGQGEDPVVVGWAADTNPNDAETLLLAGARPVGDLIASAALFSSILDFVPQWDEAEKRAARERFRGFREAGLNPVFKGAKR